MHGLNEGHIVPFKMAPAGDWNLSLWMIWTHWFHKLNTMAADALVTQGARTPAAMVLTWFPQTIHSSAPEGWRKSCTGKYLWTNHCRVRYHIFLHFWFVWIIYLCLLILHTVLFFISSFVHCFENIPILLLHCTMGPQCEHQIINYG